MSFMRIKGSGLDLDFNEIFEATFDRNPFFQKSNLPPPGARLDVRRDEEGRIYTLDLPGVRKENLSIEVVDGTLRVKWNRAGRENGEIDLAEDVDDENIDARLEDGVLTVKVVSRKRSSRKVEVR